MNVRGESLAATLVPRSAYQGEASIVTENRGAKNPRDFCNETRIDYFAAA
jgi:hypothetical protein